MSHFLSFPPSFSRLPKVSRNDLLKQLTAAGWTPRESSTPSDFLELHKPASTSFVFVYKSNVQFGDDDPQANPPLDYKTFDQAYALLLGTN